MVCACLDTCCSHFLTIIAGVDLHFRHESELPVCRTRVAVVQGEAANHYTNAVYQRVNFEPCQYFLKKFPAKCFICAHINSFLHKLICFGCAEYQPRLSCICCKICFILQRMSRKTPSDFLKQISGQPVVVKLNSGIDYRGNYHMHRNNCFKE